jgi:hypothetical protein
MDTGLVVGAYGTIGDRRPRDEQRGKHGQQDRSGTATSGISAEAEAAKAPPADQATFETTLPSATETLFETTLLANKLPHGTSEACDRALRDARSWPAPESALHLRDKTI